MVTTTMSFSSGPSELNKAELAQAFPFHFGIDSESRITQVGGVLRRIAPDLAVGTRLDEHFAVVRPSGCRTFADICAHKSSLFLLRHRRRENLTLKGQMLVRQSGDAVIFLGSPWLTNLSQLEALSLTLADLAIHDPAADFLLLLQSQQTALADLARLTQELETLNATLESRVGERTRTLARMNEELEAQRLQLERTLAGLLESRRRYEALVGAVDGVVWESDPEMRLTFVSAQAQPMFGYVPAQWIGNHTLWRECVHPEDRQGVLDECRRAVAEKRRLALEYRMTDAHGRIHWVRNTMGVAVEADVVVAVRGLLVDITEQRSAAETLREKSDQLQQAQKMEAIGRLAGGVAHDFNNLLTAMQGYGAMVLRQLEPNHPVRADVEEIRKAAESAASLTRQLLAFSRRQMLQPQILALNGVITRVESLLARVIGEDITLVKRLDEGLGLVSADPGQIEQIIMNLAVNARDAMPNGGELTIETKNVELADAYVARHHGASPGPHVMLAVSDTGVGMTEEVRSRIFEPFFTTKEAGRGTGLGLATVYGTVEQSGGSIWVYSEPGHGTTFKIYLPVVEKPFNDAPAARTEAAPKRGRETILVVEDQDAVRAVVRKTLATHGYVVLEAGLGAEALEVVDGHSTRIDLLLTDVVMPTMSGRELAERIRAIHPAIRVLYMSGYTDEAVVRNGILGSAVPFLQKPFTPNVLVQRVREVLDAL